MALETLFLAATLLVILINLVGREGIRRHFRVSSGKDTPQQHRVFLHIVVPWVVRLEFLYYLALLVFVVFMPDLLPMSAVIFLVIYHTVGFWLSERYEARFKIAPIRPASPLSPASLRLISALDGFEMGWLLYFCVILIRGIATQN